MTRKSLKIGRYTEEEIFQYMTDVEGSMLGRSMYDAVFGTIHALITEKNQLKKDNETLQKKLQSSEKFAEKLQRELNQRDKVINEVADYIKSDLLLFDNDSIEHEIGIEILKILERTDK